MEYCKGGSLFQYLKKRGFKLPEKKVAEIIHKLCVAVYYIHSYGIIHRDLKPENILMTDDTDSADIRLLDFGLGKIIGPCEKCQEPFGTIYYAAPEVLNGQPYNQAIDIWSLGIITFLMLTGRLPFDSDEDDSKNDVSVARQILTSTAPFFASLWKNISIEAKNFVESTLQKLPEKRPTIKMLLENEWFKMYYPRATIKRKESNNFQQSHFSVYTTTNPNKF